jgi:hypothetical protein
MPSKKRGPKKFLIDKRAAQVAAIPGNDDDLLTTEQLATWFGVSTQWLEIMRHRGGGPEYERIGPRTIRYLRGKARRWLGTRSHTHTQEYEKRR